VAYNVSVYKNGRLLGTGSMTNGSKTVSTYSGTAPISGRNVSITATGGNNTGATINTRVVTDGGTSLTLYDAGPYS
jgi:hypothetical protein